MDVTLLGTLGWMPRGARETTCFAVRTGSVLLLFDAGTGFRRLLDPEHAGLLDGAAEVHLFLSHYHLDHVCGLAYLSGVLAGRDVIIHPPEEELTGVDPLAAVSELVRRPYNPVDLADMKLVRVEPASRENEVAGHVVRLRPQSHTDTSVSFRIDDELVIATDTSPDPDAVAYAEGAGLWLHEAWYWAGDPALAACRRSSARATRRTARRRPSPASPRRQVSAASSSSTSTRSPARSRTCRCATRRGRCSRARTWSRTARSRRRPRPFDTSARAPRGFSRGFRMIRFRDKRFLAVAIVVAALVIFVLPAFVAFRYTAPEQRGQFLTKPWRGWSFAWAALAVPSNAELKTSGMALRKADWLYKGTAVDPREVQLLFVKTKKPYTFTHSIDGRTLTSTVVPAYRFIWQVQGVVDTVSDSSDTVVALLDYKTGRVLYDIRDDLTPAELAPQPGDSASPSPAP